MEKKPKIAIVHDWFIHPGGSEKVTAQLLELYPEADLFCLMDFMDHKNRKKFLGNRTATTSKIQLLPFAKNYYRFLFPLFPKAITHLDLKKYDVLISSSHSIAKGIKKLPHQTHICYIHTPVRYAWDLKKQYLKQIPINFVRQILNNQLNKLKKWDLENTRDVDFIISNSKNVSNRIEQNYNRDSRVIYPPVDTKYFNLPEKEIETKDYFFVVSRLVLYKRVDLIVKAFNNFPNQKLIIAGDGPQRVPLQNIANSNIEFVGYQPDHKIKELIQNAKATVFAANEDFGITPVESQACGTPVIALNRGGYMETVQNKISGILYESQTVNSLISGIQEFIDTQSQFNVKDIRANSIKFGTERFKNEITEFVNEKLAI